MAGRIPMVGDPKPLDTKKMAEDLKVSTHRMLAEAGQLLSDAQAKGDAKGIDEAQKLLKGVQKLIDDYGF